MPNDPQTPKEWQEAVDMAYFLLLIDSARQYGLITGGPEIDWHHCVDIVERGEKLGYKPKKFSA